MVRLLYFASVRETVGRDEEQRQAPGDVKTPRDLAAWLAGQGENYAAAFADMTKLRCAVDQEMRALDAPLGEAKEIAFFPPVTGG